jgi:hypothetical protein
VFETIKRCYRDHTLEIVNVQAAGGVIFIDVKVRSWEVDIFEILYLAFALAISDVRRDPSVKRPTYDAELLKELYG